MPLLPKTKISPKTATITGKIKGAPRIRTTNLFPKNFDVEALWLQEWQELLKELLSRQPEQM